MSCTHYDCNADIQSFCCKEFFNCRICHDTAKNEEEKDPKKMHTLNRYLIEIVRCRICKTEQPPEQNCINCGVCLGSYFCKVCRIYENNTEKKIYHCEGCKICRIGPQEYFFHCDTCEACLNISTKDTHVCTVGVMKVNCVICQENIFFSRMSSMPMKCGHFIHSTCYEEMIKSNHLTCPLCLKYVVKGVGRMTEMIDREIAATPMPEEYKSLEVDILCNECGAKSKIPFHFYGLKCQECGLFNTTRC